MKRFGALALMGAMAEARPRTEVTADGRYVKSPAQVELSKNDDLCIFKNDYDMFCFTQYSPAAVLGMEWRQDFFKFRVGVDNVDYYRLDLVLFGNVDVDIDLILAIDQFLRLGTYFTMDRFSTDILFSFIVRSDGKLCGGIGYDSDEINTNWEMSL